MNSPAKDKPKLLYVDDDQENLATLRRALWADFNVEVAGSAKEGCEKLENFDFEVIVADQRMPGQTGVEFLKEVVGGNGSGGW